MLATYKQAYDVLQAVVWLKWNGVCFGVSGGKFGLLNV